MDQTQFEHNARMVRLATVSSVSVACFLIVVKMLAWWTTDSVSLQATLVDSILDAFASSVNLLAVRKAQQPATKIYRFGHGKAEALAALGQSVFIYASAGWLIYEVVDHLIHPEILEPTMISMVVMVIALSMTYGLLRFQNKVIRLTNSQAIKADSLHYRTDFLINGGVIVSLIGASFHGFSWLDPIIGGIIACYILYNAYLMTRDAIATLMDREIPNDQRQKLKDVISQCHHVKKVVRFRTRSSGQHVFVQLIVAFDPYLSLQNAYKIKQDLRANMQKALPQADILVVMKPLSALS